MTNKKIEFNGEELEISKIKIKNIGALAATLKDLPELFIDVFVSGSDEVNELDTKAILNHAPTIIIQAGETLPPFLSVASGIEIDKINEGGLDDLVVLIDTVLQLNNFELIVSYLKNFIPTQTTK